MVARLGHFIEICLKEVLEPLGGDSEIRMVHMLVLGVVLRGLIHSGHLLLTIRLEYDVMHVIIVAHRLVVRLPLRLSELLQTMTI